MEAATPRQKAFLSYMGVAIPSDLSREKAALLVIHQRLRIRQARGVERSRYPDDVREVSHFRETVEEPARRVFVGHPENRGVPEMRLEVGLLLRCAPHDHDTGIP